MERNVGKSQRQPPTFPLQEPRSDGLLAGAINLISQFGDLLNDVRIAQARLIHSPAQAKTQPSLQGAKTVAAVPRLSVVEQATRLLDCCQINLPTLRKQGFQQGFEFCSLLLSSFLELFQPLYSLFLLNSFLLS
jgi:hypothetical protein